MDAARTLRDARRRARLSQAEVAARARTSQSTVSAYESGAKQPSLATLTRLLAVTGRRLTAETVPRHVREPSATEHGRAARALADVLSLAEALPTRHEPELRFPRLSSGSPPAR
jgi:transcriptional regulator with XRE-family HTH domain